MFSILIVAALILIVLTVRSAICRLDNYALCMYAVEPHIVNRYDDDDDDKN